MNIFNNITNQNVSTNTSYESISSSTLQQYKNLTDLVAGDIFKAEILDIKLTGLTIKLANGETLSAKTMVLPDSRIGEDSFFKVKDNINGQLRLEMLKPTEDTAMEKMAISVLKNAELFTTDENIELVKSMIKENMPLDANTLEKALFFRHSNENMTADKALFLLKEDFPLTSDSVDKLLNYIDNTNGFSDNLDNLKNSILELDAKNQNAFFKVILDFAKEFDISLNKDDLLDRLFLNIEEDNLEDTSKHFKFLEKTIEEFKNIADNTNNDKLSELTKNVKNQLDFMNDLKTYKEFIQFPLSVNDNTKQAELHVFKDGNKKKDLRKQASILLALDYDTLGHLDIFINKNDKTLSIQFETATDNTIHSLKTNIKDLDKLLREKDFRLTNTSFVKSEEKHSLIDTKFHGNKDDTSTANKSSTKRFSFDMHV